MYLTGVGVPEKLLTGVKVTVPSVALVYVPCPAMVTTPSLTEHVGVVGVSGQESTNELGTKDAPEPAESLVPATLDRTFIDWATPCGPEVVSGVAVGAP